MKIPFYKYQGTGNDFVMIDNRRKKWLTRKDTVLIEHLCNRRFGIGADGLILLQNHADFDFEMVYFNADGRESSMCGNGGRCTVAFAHFLGVIDQSCRFLAIDGEHQATIKDGNWVELKMIDVPTVEKGDNFFILNTGSPHYITFVPQVQGFDVFQMGKNIRYSDRFKKEGINVNFVEIEPNQSIQVATYERGVEDETLSCGTGVTAAAIATVLHTQQLNGKNSVKIQTKGGTLAVRFEPNATQGFQEIWLCGPAMQVFKGAITV